MGGQNDGNAFRLEVEDCYYEIDFEHMIQRNVSSGRTRSITREMQEVQWRWAGSMSRTHAFDNDSNFKLEEAYQEWRSTEDPERETFRLQVSDHMYVINFLAMTQQNLESCRQRAVSRYVRKCTALSESRSVSDCTTAASLPSETSLRRRNRGMERVSSSRPSEEYPHTLKIVFMGVALRLRVAWPPNVGPVEVVAKIDAAVRDGIGRHLDQDAQLALKYTDDDGDMCSLVQETLEDCLSFARNGVLKLLVEQTSLDYTKPIGVVATARVTSQDNISIASPRGSPQLNCTFEHTIDEEYESSWDLVEPLVTTAAKEESCDTVEEATIVV